jgi:hypothetical protein
MLMIWNVLMWPLRQLSDAADRFRENLPENEPGISEAERDRRWSKRQW